MTDYEAAKARTEPPLVLYRQALLSSRSGPLFNAFSYPTKISAEAVGLFIATHTRPNETVLDAFSGSGSTGIGAILAERPTENMRAVAQGLGLSPEWGPRDAVLYDISEIGTLAARAMTSSPAPADFLSAARGLLERVRQVLPGAYDIYGPDGQDGEVRHIVWTERIICPSCSASKNYADARVRYGPMRFADEWRCDRCNATNSVDGCERETESFHDHLLNATRSRRVRVPWKIYGRSEGKSWSRMATAEDVSRILGAPRLSTAKGAPLHELVWGDLFRSGYHFGIEYLHDFYTPRNFAVMSQCFAMIDEAPPSLRDALRLWLLSYNATHSTLMTRVVLKKNSADFVLTGAQSGVLYVSALPVEKNILEGLARKSLVFARAFEMTHGTSSHVSVVTGSSGSLSLDDGSVDYCFTDPPFGDYIPYSEVNQVNELWLGRTTNSNDEAVISRTQGKGVAEYGGLLSQVFGEISRCLKPTGRMTLVFHSSKADVWRAMVSALRSAGLRVESAGVLDKGQGSFKQVGAHRGVEGDPLMLVVKDALSGEPSNASSDLASRVVNEALAVGDQTELSRERLYSRYVGLSLQEGAEVTLDARDFYEMHAELVRR